MITSPDIRIDISKLDPLGADSAMSGLPNLNAAKDTEGLIRLTSSLLPSPQTVENFNQSEARAALRDLGMLAASLKRHGIEPVDVVSNLDNSLFNLGQTAGTVPRDTVFSYGPWNPQGQRQRVFTNEKEEKIFINSFRDGMSGLTRSAGHLLEARSFHSSSLEFSQLCEEAQQDFSLMVDAIVKVRRLVPAKVFTFKLRPYFDPYTVDGREYFAPGGAQMPVLLIDQLLWGSDCDESWYTDYLQTSIEYTLPEHRLVSDSLQGQESLVSKTIRESEGGVDKDSRSVNILRSFLNEIISFRQPHLAVARSNFKLRGSQDVGSGGYRPNILYLLVDKTASMRKALGYYHD